MGIDYGLRMSINEKKENVNEFINHVLNIIFPNETHSYNVSESDFYIGITTDLYTLNIGKFNDVSRQFTLEDYGVDVNTSLSFRPYGETRVEGAREMIKLVFSLLKKYDGDCILLPNGDYAAILRHKGELFIDTSKGFFNNFDLSLIDIPYTDKVIDEI